MKPLQNAAYSLKGDQVINFLYKNKKKEYTYRYVKGIEKLITLITLLASKPCGTRDTAVINLITELITLFEKT